MRTKFTYFLPPDQNTKTRVDLAFLTVFVCSAYIVSEWLLIVIKPSIMSDTSLKIKLVILFQSILLFSAIAVATLLIVFLLEWVFRLNDKDLGIKVGKLIPALILSGMFLLLLDNFTYSVLNFQIITTHGVFRAAYTLFFLLLIFITSRFLIQWLPLNFGSPKLKIAIIMLLFGSAMINSFTQGWNKRIAPAELNPTDNKPNIILIGSNGMNADNMSVYGYNRETTPNIKKFAEESLIVENHFSNSSNTWGSLTAILTGIHPTQTRVLHPPDVLQNKEAYRHLPGILKLAGYYNVELSDPYIANTYTVDLLDGFDMVNDRSSNNKMYYKLLNYGFSNNSAYFIATLYDRIVTRILYIFFVVETRDPPDQDMKNPNLIPDKVKLKSLFEQMENHRDHPVFIHIHFTGANGKTLNLDSQKFSAQRTGNQPQDRDLYDDSIFNFDLLFGKLIKRLENRNLLDNTLIILYSDHGIEFDPNKRIPLIIRFPNASHAGRRVTIGQNLDVAPTILDYLKITRPTWMSGNSLLQNRAVLPSVISTGRTNDLIQKGDEWDQTEMQTTPLSYQFDFFNIINCQKWFRLDIKTYQWSSGDIENFVHPCSKQDLLHPDQIIKIVMDRLSKDEFEIPIGLLNVEKITNIGKQSDPLLLEENIPGTASSTLFDTQLTDVVPWEYPVTGWNPLIAHGFGAWEGIGSPNNYEAFLESYEEGFRNFEVDITISSDGIPLAAHDRMEKNYYSLENKFSDYTAEEFLRSKLKNSGTTMSGPEILKLLEEYKDIRIVLDIKVHDRNQAIGWFLTRLPKSQWPRVLTNVQTEDQIKRLLQEFPDYRGAFLQLAPWNENRIINDEDAKRLVTEYDLAGIFTWVEELDPDLDLIENNVKHKRWTPTLADYMTEAGKATILHTTDNPELIEIRRALGAAIITDNSIPQQTPQRVVLITIDGLRPDVIDEERMPNLTALMNDGAYSLAAQTISPNLTLPAHTSILTGLCPSQHGVTWNQYQPENGYSKGPDLYELADAAGLRTAMIVGKIKLQQITEPENIDLFKLVNGGDQLIAREAAKIIKNGFDLLFIHLPDTDALGHKYGWMSEEQLLNIFETDRALGMITDTLKKTGRKEGTLIIVTADHGGHDKSHGSDRPEDLTVPWIISGFNVVHQKLTQPINVTDTAPTIAYALNIQIPPEWDGHPILDVFGIYNNPKFQTFCR